MRSYSPRLTERTHPTRPEYATSHPKTPNLPSQSFNTYRATSPSSSIRSRDSEKDRELEVKHEIDHVRERNWNSPHPKWTPSTRYEERPVSPLSPLLPSLSPKPSFSHTRSHSHNARVGTPRVESPTSHMRTGKSPLRPSTSRSSLIINKSSPRASSPLVHSNKDKHPISNGHLPGHTSRSFSPISSADPVDSHAKENGISKMPASGSRFGWQFPRNKTQLPPWISISILQSGMSMPCTPGHCPHLRPLQS